MLRGFFSHFRSYQLYFDFFFIKIIWTDPKRHLNP